MSDERSQVKTAFMVVFAIIAIALTAYLIYQLYKYFTTEKFEPNPSGTTNIVERFKKWANEQTLRTKSKLRQSVVSQAPAPAGSMRLSANRPMPVLIADGTQNATRLSANNPIPASVADRIQNATRLSANGPVFIANGREYPILNTPY